MKLMMVNHGYVLHDPRASGLQKTWLVAGQTLDMDDEWVVLEVRGQEYKLVPASIDAIETPKSKWPPVLFNRWSAHVARRVPEAITQRVPETESVTVESKRRGRRKASEE